MALRTGQVFRAAVEFKTGIVMVKNDGLPPLVSMAPGTVILL